MDTSLPISPDWNEEVEEFAKHHLQALKQEDTSGLQLLRTRKDTHDPPQLTLEQALDFVLMAHRRLPAPLFEQFFETLEQIQSGEGDIPLPWVRLQVIFWAANEYEIWEHIEKNWMPLACKTEKELEGSELILSEVMRTSRDVSQPGTEGLEELEMDSK